jgi:hypothetical protein
MTDRIVDTLFSDAFDRPRDPRSAEYKAGFRAGAAEVLAGRVGGLFAPHPHGTAQADAWYAGMQEGADAARWWLRDHPDARPQSGLRP